MISADRALRIILKSLAPLGKEKVKIASAAGRVLAEDIVASEPLPSFMNSSIDGFAVRAGDVASASRKKPVVLKVVGESGAGNPFDGDLKRGQIVQVMTGGMIPQGLDAVVPIEETDPGKDGSVRFHSPVERGIYIRKPGEDIKKGEKVVRAGEMVTAPGVGVLASLGYTKVRVHTAPRVNIMATGDELVEFNDPVQAGQVRNSTSHILRAYVEEDGGIP
ncbi:MAG: molybdopterin molybdotransferase MoeA, partial [Ignavibacteria bacterium]|nr:molybdopterin molybdotransferase MoeA [Ignavibacteria bacterium]